MLRRLSSRVAATNGFQVSALPNGIKVASANTIPGGPFCSTGILMRTAGLNAGAEPNAVGTASSYVLEKLAFKATSKIGAEEMQKRLDKFVGSALSKSNRESLLISAAIIPDQAQEVLSLLDEIARDTVITAEDLEEIKAVVAYDLQELENKLDELIPELVHGPAFYPGAEAGNSIVSVPATLELLTKEDVYGFRKSLFARGNVYAVAAGIPHDQFLEMAYETMGSGPALPSANTKSSSPLSYHGGQKYIEVDESPLIHIGIGFRGLPAGHPDAYSQAVLQMLLGGGGSFSAGGPGKGMYSRLYTRVLNRHHWIESARVFSQAYSSTGVFGIHGSALPSHAQELTLTLLSEMAALAQQPVSTVEFERAKAQVRSAVLMGLESRMTQLEDLADQLVHRSEEKLESPSEVCAMIDAVQPEDLTHLAQSIISGGRPSIVAYGPLKKMPSYDQILQWASRLL